ncbi:16S rRNA (guanine(966)-N(2))-methyltransferase RsmD [Collinsella sp. zg1085]|uniref:16S rRNA (guanine(966)-N(2))-methyltransferase RsmD n=1 Tax=Collinsella sp. zg1085 TaxID=2844380 RepID=UPI001C0E7F18|nr:16S rRNA (guanine(966)-N(2))-methyltransferase RsmD [Collinsella sp. zg1085]QWT17127.1 16S rRNA (guanine(966)-N(2))-methyltransferase RsmD [Collinsella sp. zg1085]
MRVIAGEWRGRKLFEPKGRDTVRPTTDRVREAIASMLEAARDAGIEGSRVLDAFAGSGALGIEMLSRGASFVQFFDCNKHSIALIQKNLDSLPGAAVHSRVQLGDVLAQRWHVQQMQPFDMVLIDPPYALGPEPAERLIAQLISAKMLAPGALILVERAQQSPAPKLSECSLYKEKRYGSSAVNIYRFDTMSALQN